MTYIFKLLDKIKGINFIFNKFLYVIFAIFVAQIFFITTNQYFLLNYGFLCDYITQINSALSEFNKANNYYSMLGIFFHKINLISYLFISKFNLNLHALVYISNVFFSGILIFIYLLINYREKNKIPVSILLFSIILCFYFFPPRIGIPNIFFGFTTTTYNTTIFALSILYFSYLLQFRNCNNAILNKREIFKISFINTLINFIVFNYKISFLFLFLSIAFGFFIQIKTFKKKFYFILFGLISAVVLFGLCYFLFDYNFLEYINKFLISKKETYIFKSFRKITIWFIVYFVLFSLSYLVCSVKKFKFFKKEIFINIIIYSIYFYITLLSLTLSSFYHKALLIAIIALIAMFFSRHSLLKDISKIFIAIISFFMICSIGKYCYEISFKKKNYLEFNLKTKFDNPILPKKHHQMNILINKNWDENIYSFYKDRSKLNKVDLITYSIDTEKLIEDSGAWKNFTSLSNYAKSLISLFTVYDYIKMLQNTQEIIVKNNISKAKITSLDFINSFHFTNNTPFVKNERHWLHLSVSIFLSNLGQFIGEQAKNSDIIFIPTTGHEKWNQNIINCAFYKYNKDNKKPFKMWLISEYGIFFAREDYLLKNKKQKEIFKYDFLDKDIENLCKHYHTDETLPSSTAFIINLDKYPERFAYVRNQLETFNIKSQRFSAINGYKIKIEDDKKNIYSGKDLKNYKFFPIKNKTYKVKCSSELSFNIKYLNVKGYSNEVPNFLTPGELGCACSHYSLVNKAFKENYNHLIVFEDDATFNKNLSTILNKIPSNWGKKCDILYLYFPKGNRLKIPNICTNKICKQLTKINFLNSLVNRYTEGFSFLKKVHKDRSFHGGVGYIVSKNGINKLNTLLQDIPGNFPIDLYYQYLVHQEKINACYLKDSFISVNYQLGSNIQEMTDVKIRNIHENP